MALESAADSNIRVVSLSTGSYTTKTDFSSDLFGLVSLQAFRKGVLVCTSAGNKGPDSETLTSRAVPWALVVGACSGGKVISSFLEIAVEKTRKLPHGISPIGGPYGKYMLVDKMKMPFNKLKYQKHFSPLRMRKCKAEDLKDKESILVSADDSASLLLHACTKDVARWLGMESGRYAIKLTVQETRSLLDWMEKFGDDLHLRKVDSFEDDSRTYFVSDFSSRGPSTLYKEMIMLDVVAPRVVITLFPPEISTTNPLEENLSYMLSETYIDGGTSFSCLIVAGVAALIFEKHPTWRPSAVKSAIVTTAASLAEV